MHSPELPHPETEPPMSTLPHLAALSFVLSPIAHRFADPQNPQEPQGPNLELEEASRLSPRIREALPRMVELLRSGIERKEPQANVWIRKGEATVFDGSYDWHSCVLAHWSLLAMGRRLGDEAAIEFVLDRLSPERLEAERSLLAANTDKHFTAPYEDAVLLVLLAELSRHEVQDPELLRRFRLETEGRVLDWLERERFPEALPPASQGGQPVCGFYRSWLWAHLCLRLSEPITPGATVRLDALTRDRVLPRVDEIRSQTEPFAFDFLWVPTLGALMERADPTFPTYTKWWAVPEAQEFPELPGEVRISTVHVVGLELSRIWPDAWDLAHDPDDARARARFEERMHAVLEREDLWAEDFTVCTHWVPQYLWIGIWLAEGRP